MSSSMRPTSESASCCCRGTSCLSFCETTTWKSANKVSSSLRAFAPSAFLLGAREAMILAPSFCTIFNEPLTLDSTPRKLIRNARSSLDVFELLAPPNRLVIDRQTVTQQRLGVRDRIRFQFRDLSDLHRRHRRRERLQRRRRHQHADAAIAIKLFANVFPTHGALFARPRPRDSRARLSRTTASDAPRVTRLARRTASDG